MLLGQTNIADNEKASALAAQMGHPMTERVMNDVHYLRTEGRDLDMLGSNIISQFYGVPREKKLDLITDGFDCHQRPNPYVRCQALRAMWCSGG